MNEKRMWTTQVLSEWISSLKPKDISPQAKEMAKRCLLDLVGVALAGYSSLSAQAMRSLALSLFSLGPSGLWFSGSRLQAEGSALGNSAAASALDLDDGHRLAAGHPGASIIPAVLAVGEEVKATGDELLSAIIIGYEVGTRVSSARDFPSLDTMSTGRWCSYGAATAGGWLRKFAPPLLAEALSVAGVQSPGLSAAGYSSVMGNSVKEGIPWSTFTGLSALRLVEKGFTGPVDLLDHSSYYQSQKILEGLGQGSFAIEKTYFKPYACCRWIHSALDAFVKLAAEYRLEGAEIKKIRVDTFKRSLMLNNYPNPDSLESAQYSFPFCLALMALRGKESLLPIRSEFLMQSDVIELARRVELRLDPELEALFPEKTSNRVVLETSRGVFEARVDVPLGDPGNPIEISELEAKFRKLSERELSHQGQEEIISAIASLEKGTPKLLSLLEGPLKKHF
jgi:2-methylcitrate dehydratase PrpD